MKRLFKKIAAVVAAASMVVAMGATAFAADTVRVCGDEGLTGASWDLTKNEMTANGGTYEITFTNVAAGEYGFKVVKGDAWGDAYNLEGSANGMGDDAKVTVDKDGSTVVIKFDGSKASVEVKAAEAPTTTKTEAPTTTKTEDPTTTKTEDPTTNKDGETVAPETGDSSVAVLMLAVAAVAAGAVVVSRKRAVNE